MRGARGMTIIEMMIVAVIFTGIFGAILLSLLMGNRMYVSSEAHVHVQEEARRALQNMARDLRGAGGDVTAAGSQLDFQLVLGYDMAAPCPPADTCWGAHDANGASQADWTVRYRLIGTQLVRELLNAGGVVQPGTRVLANDVSQLTFTYAGAVNGTVTIQIVTRRPLVGFPGGGITSSPAPLVFQIRLRNPSF